MAERAVPVRTCVGCRRRAAATDLLRVVAVDGTVVPDPARRAGGRGASLHPDLGCLTLAERRRAFGRALRVPSDLTTEPLRAYLVAAQVGTSITSTDQITST